MPLKRIAVKGTTSRKSGSTTDAKDLNAESADETACVDGGSTVQSGYNPFLNRLDRKAVQSKGYWRARKQEKAIARTISGSGSGRKKGDVEVMGVARLECKTTQNKSFSVTREMVEKITNAGIGSGEVPAIVIEFLDQQGNPESDVCVIPMWALQRLIAIAREHYDAEEGKTS